jgi:uncharacterized membrane protein
MVLRWTFEGGVEHLVEPSGLFAPVATAISGDGSIILGGSLSGRTGFRWTRETGYVIQADLSPRALSSDGAYEFGVLPNSSNAPYRRTHATGEVQPIGASGNPMAASADGSVVVGHLAAHLEGGAWRWTAATGQVSLGALPDGATRSEARDVTPDGSVIVGYAWYPEGNGAFRWTESAGYETLDMLDDGVSSSAVGVAADGRTIVGNSFLSDGTEVATIWLPDGSAYDFHEYLTLLGADVTGWRFSSIEGISDDGLTIAGDGVNPEGLTEGWVARIPSPGSAALLLGLMLTTRRRGAASAR